MVDAARMMARDAEDMQEECRRQLSPYWHKHMGRWHLYPFAADHDPQEEADDGG